MSRFSLNTKEILNSNALSFEIHVHDVILRLLECFFYNQVLQDIHIKNFSKFMLLTIFKDNSNALAATNAS